VSDDRPHFPPSEDPWGATPTPAQPPVYGEGYPSSPSSPGPDFASYGTTGYDPTPYDSTAAPAYTPYASTPDPGAYGQTPTEPVTPAATTWAAAYPPAATGWPAQPPAQGSVPPAAPRRPYAMVGAVALVAALIGGAIGGTIASGDDGGSGTSVSSLGAAGNGEIKPVAAAPQGAVEQVAAKVLPSVVSIDISEGGQSAISGSGSGIVIGSDGLILTNNHVAGTGTLSVTFSDGNTVPAKLIKADPTTDLAVIKAAGISNAQPISFGKSGDLRVGQDVVAIGAPLGLAGTVTTGIISALQRPVVPQESSGDASVIDGIQTDAPINPGNSGGALVDLNGNLVGITSAIASLGGGLGGQSGSIGLGFAIPIDQARVIAEQLAAGKTVAHALLGVQVTNATDASQHGALIREVSKGGAAEKAGLRSGDIVTRLDSRVIGTSDALVAGVRSLPPGNKVTLTYLRDGQTKTAVVTLGSDA
jgi:putative serine protease PepD